VTDDGKTGYEVIGVLPGWVLERLWPSVDGDCEVWLSMDSLRRHLAGKPDGASRTRLLDAHGELVRGSLARADVYVRYDHAPTGDAGVNVLVPIDQGRHYLVVGLRVAGVGTRTPFTHVATVFAVGCSRAKNMAARHGSVPARRSSGC
jgi:hypothetical protein